MKRAKVWTPEVENCEWRVLDNGGGSHKGSPSLTPVTLLARLPHARDGVERRRRVQECVWRARVLGQWLVLKATVEAEWILDILVRLYCVYPQVNTGVILTRARTGRRKRERECADKFLHRVKVFTYA